MLNRCVRIGIARHGEPLGGRHGQQLRYQTTARSGNSRALRDPVAVRGTIDVELVDSKIVNTDERGSGGNRGGRQDATKDASKDNEPRGDHPPHDLVANPDASQVILRERDVRVQEREHPDHALLRLRAYRPSVDDTAFAPSDDPHADFKA